uniref:Uroplakin 3A n=1 Tax=Sphenodon punctatus TaxID=8508 RepID=A0A8D0HL78_SPHPU
MQTHLGSQPTFWEPLALMCSLRPQIANTRFATNNPTLTTVALEKPFCVFDGSLSQGVSYVVYLYVKADAGNSSVTDNSSKPLDTTFQETNGGQLGPYKAATFGVPNCASPPKLSDVTDTQKVSDLLNQYLLRVGDDRSCLYDPNFQGACNPPLVQNTAYRFKYILVDKAAGVMKDQTLWSDQIKTNKMKQSSTIDTWPGRRSGGMIVVTSILSTLMFFLLLGFLASIFCVVNGSGEPETAMETRHESQITQQGVLSVQGSAETAN